MIGVALKRNKEKMRSVLQKTCLDFVCCKQLKYLKRVLFLRNTLFQMWSAEDEDENMRNISYPIKWNTCFAIELGPFYLNKFKIQNNRDGSKHRNKSAKYLSVLDSDPFVPTILSSAE